MYQGGVKSTVSGVFEEGMFKIIRIFLKNIFVENYQFRSTFFIIDIF